MANRIMGITVEIGGDTTKLQTALTILKSALEGLSISFGQLLMPAVKNIVSWLQKFVDWLNSMDEGTKKVIMTIVPKISGAITAVKTAFAALNVTMLANPIVLIIAAITALVAAFIYLWNTNEGFRQFWIELWENVKQVAITVYRMASHLLQKCRVNTALTAAPSAIRPLTRWMSCASLAVMQMKRRYPVSRALPTKSIVSTA